MPNPDPDLVFNPIEAPIVEDLQTDVAALEAVDAADAYTPAVGGNYSPAVTTRHAALDQLAARVKALEDA